MVTVINRVTFLVVVIGAAALLIVLSGFSGLKTFSIAFSTNFDPDLKALSASGKFFDLSYQEEERLKQVEGLAAYSKEVEERVFLTFQQKNHVAYIKGVDSAYTRVTQVDSVLYTGTWLSGFSNEVVVGLGTASLLGLAVGDSENLLKILAPKPGGVIRSDPRPYNELLASVAGVYAVNEELDKKYVFASMATVQSLLGKEASQLTGINFKLREGAERVAVAAAISEILKDKVSLKTRQQLNDVLYKMLNTENLAIYFIFTLVLIIALFNVVGAVFMMILEKKENLRTLFCLGVTVKKLKTLFFLQGLSLSVVGGAAGILLAMALVSSQQAFGWLTITATLPYPVELTVFNVVVVFVTITILGAAAAGIAASRISEKHLTA